MLPVDVRRKRRVLGAFLGLLLVLLLPATAWANAAPSPNLYVRFDNLPAEVRAVGVQLQGCTDEGCAQPTLLLSDGVCGSGDCRSETPQWDTILPQVIQEHGQAVTLMMPFASTAEGQYVRLVVQFSDNTVRSSQALHAERIEYRSFYRAFVSEAGIELQQYQAFPPVLNGSELLTLVPVLVLNLLLEPLIGMGYARLRRVSGVRALGLTLLAINLLSFPLIWGAFPAMSPFALPGTTWFGWMSLGFVVIAGAVATTLPSIPRLRSSHILIILLVLLPLLCAALVMTAIPLPPVQLPLLPFLSSRLWVNLLVIETVIVLLEGALLYRLRRDSISLSDSLILALLANSVSLAVGFALTV